jgi:hypothetical protein
MAWKRHFDAATTAEDLLRIADGLTWMHKRVGEIRKTLRSAARAEATALIRKHGRGGARGRTTANMRRFIAAQEHLENLDVQDGARLRCLGLAAGALTKGRKSAKRKARKAKR